MFRSFFTKETIIITLAMIMITIISIGMFFAPLLRYRCLGDNKRYTKDLYYTWHNIYVNEPCELVMFSEPSLANWSVTAIYKYGSDNLDVKQKYIKLLKDNDWKLERVESSKQIFLKNNLLYYLEEEGNGVIKISVKLKGYDDTSLLNKIIYGVN